MKLSKWILPGIVLIILGALTQDGSSTIMGTMLLGSMAANSAMLLGKMGLGGLMMMMMSQQYGGGGGAGGGGDNPGLLASLGNLGRQLGNTLNTLSGAASNMNNKRTTRSHAPISLAPPAASATASSGATAGTVVKKVRYSRPIQPNPAHSHSGHSHTHNSHAHSHNHGHGHAHGHAVQDQVQSWPATPSQSSGPVQIQGYATPTLQELQDQQILNQLHQEIQKQQRLQQAYRKRVARSVVEPPAGNGPEASSTTSTTSTTTTAVPPPPAAGSESVQYASAEHPPAEDDEEVTKKLLTYTRLMRQADSFDYMSCLPKFVCGLEAQPPTKKTSILNDYSHLLKLLFGPDDDDDDDELDDEVPSDEDVNVNHADAYRLALSNKDRLDEKVNDELLDEDPEMLGYVLKDIAKKGLKKNKNKFGYNPQMNSPMGHYYPSMNLPLEEDEPPQSSSILSSFLPKISAGFGTSSKSDDPTFDNDPFFSGFKRSLDMPVVGVDAAAAQAQSANNEINVNDFEDGGQNVKRSKRISDNSRRRRKREAIEEIVQNDPVITKYRRAQEIGRQSSKKGSGQRDCSNAFKNCPYSWDQIMGMVSNMRNVISPNGTRTPSPSPDKVVVLQVPAQGGSLGKTSATKTYTRNGATKVTHDMGNGNVMQITVKLAPKVTGFEPVPVVESEPYQENDELDVGPVKLIPKFTKPMPRTTTTTTPKPKRTPKPKPVDAAVGELDTPDPDTEEESDELSSEQEKGIEQVAQKLHSQNIGNGTRRAKPKRKFKPSPNTNFDFASDVDIMGVKGGTILPKQGADKEVPLKRHPGLSSIRTTSRPATTPRPRPKTTTTTTITPIGSANGKTGNRPAHAPYKIKKRDPAQVVILPIKEDGSVQPAASYKDNSDDATSEENDDESDEEGPDMDDDPEAAEDEFILDDRENDFRSHSTKKRRRPVPSRFRFDDPQPQEQQPVQMSATSSGPTAVAPKYRRPPFPMLMRKSPIMHDPSKSWHPVGDGRAFSDGQQPQPQVQPDQSQQQQQ